MKYLCRGVQHFGFNAIRHFGASLLADREKVSLPTISRLLRHTDLRTTEKYFQKVDPNQRQQWSGWESRTYSPTYSPSRGSSQPPLFGHPEGF